MLTRAILLMAAWLIAAAAAAAPGYTANELTALARIDPARSEVADFGGSLQVTLTLSQPVPWRIFTLTDPARLVLDFSEVAFDGVEPGALVASDAVSDLADHPQIMRNEQHRHPGFTLQVRKKVEYLRLNRDVQCRCRFVSDQQVRIIG